ncbi:MAG: O-antigen ligase family protein [Thiotrichales bacterium]|nr:O-antigen ligase family protein [Thiotrichales bacterium]
MSFFAERAQHFVLFLLLLIFFISSATLFKQVDIFLYLIALWGMIIHFRFKEKIALEGALKVQSHLFFTVFFFITISIMLREEFLILFEYRYQNFRDLVLVYFISALFVHYRFSFNPQVIFKLISAAALYALVYSILIVIEQPYRGIGLLETPITRGNMGMLLGVLSLVAYLGLKQNLWRYVALVGAVSGIALSFLSGSRGGWATVLITFITVLYVVYQTDRKKFKEALVFTFLLLILVALFWKELPIEQRVLQTIDSIQAYFNGNSYSSLGFRFEMWKATWLAFWEKPFWGWGFNSFDKIFEMYRLEGRVTGIAGHSWGHPHNDYMLLLSEKGLIGFVVVLSVLIYPLVYLFKQLADAIGAQVMDKVYLALLGIVLIEALFEFMLSDQTITMKFQFHFYVVLILMILSQFSKADFNKEDKD